MKKTSQNKPDPNIYPGHYVPVIKKEEIQKELKCRHEGKMQLPPVNIIELPDCFKVEIAIPGLKKEDFLINADGHLLSVCVLHKDCRNHKDEVFKLHEFNFECFDRPVDLPEYADAEFTNAEYKEGILYLLVPKTKLPVKNEHTSIAVY